MAFTFRFTSTHQDLREGFYAYRTVQTGMRWWARAGVAAIGLMWLIGGVVVLAQGEPVKPSWLPLVWLALGVWVTWKFVLQPRVIIHSIVRENPPAVEIELTFDDAGVEVVAHGFGAERRPWSDLVMVEPAAKGVVFAFHDTPLHWLPDRVFATPAERESFVRYVSAKIEEAGRDAAS